MSSYPVHLSKGHQWYEVLMTPTRNILDVYSRPSVSVTNWFQDPQWILKSEDAQVPRLTLPIFDSAYAESRSCAWVALYVPTGKSLDVRGLVQCQPWCPRVTCAESPVQSPLPTQTQASCACFPPVPFFIDFPRVRKFTSQYGSLLHFHCLCSIHGTM